MPRQTHPAERRVDSLFFVLANKPWTALAVLVYTSAVFALGVAVGASVG